VLVRLGRRRRITQNQLVDGAEAHPPVVTELALPMILGQEQIKIVRVNIFN
jgi:hypothetical protein